METQGELSCCSICLAAAGQSTAICSLENEYVRVSASSCTVSCPTAKKTWGSLKYSGPQGELTVLLQERLAMDRTQEGRNRGYCIEIRNMRHRTRCLEETANSAAQGALILAENIKSLPRDQASSSAQTPHPLAMEGRSSHTCFSRNNFVQELPEISDAASTRRESTWQTLARLRYLRLWYVWVTPAPGTKSSKSLPHLSSFHGSGVYRLGATGPAPPKHLFF